jgi:hypothetical protein
MLYSILAPPPAPRPSPIRRFHLLYGNATRMVRTHDPAAVLDAVEGHMALWTAEMSRRWLFVHAGVVAWGGKAILLPGRTESGKSTLVEALVRAGATYYSDEYAALDRAARVHAYPRPIKLRERRDGDQVTPGRVWAVPETQHGRRALPVALVLATRYRPEARWRPRVISEGEAVLALLANTVSVRHQPTRTLEVLRRTVAGAALLKGSRGDTGSVIHAILERMESHDAA